MIERGGESDRGSGGGGVREREGDRRWGLVQRGPDFTGLQNHTKSNTQTCSHTAHHKALLFTEIGYFH